MKHYVKCPRMRLVISVATVAPTFSADTVELAAGTLSEATRSHRLRQWAVATLTFNTIRNNHGELANRAQADGKLPELGATLRKIAYTHALEIGGRQLARS